MYFLASCCCFKSAAGDWTDSGLSSGASGVQWLSSGANGVRSIVPEIGQIGGAPEIGQIRGAPVIGQIRGALLV